ncbi:TonB-dependent receptor plug domain-containing protein [Aquimarina agarivorans]|uniref:TonB-dependent receptor plug domain-containing protein n=1 Tax=Aquimarina agarivorans TaxID=980584 RepID=UPI001EE68D91|nr:TonB-dependent receptor plug domain-containing protein [Aquimarina agarivorans]
MAQNNYAKQILLKDYIQTLETEFDIKFSYLDFYVSKKIEKPSDQLTELNELISFLEKQTSLRFDFVDAKNIVIRPYANNDLVKICGFTKVDNKLNSNVKIQSVFSLKEIASSISGYFEIEVPYGSSLIFSLNNVILDKIAVEQLVKKDCPEILLSVYHLELEEVNLLQYLTKGVDKIGQKSVFKPKEFSVLAGLTEPDVMQSLQHIPGVQNPFETSSKLYVRGGTPDQNLVLWNGIKSYNQGHFFGLISSFNPYLIKEVDFYNKGVNAQFGDRVAGVVNLKSSQQVVDKFEGGFGANLIHADAFTRIPIIKDRLSIEVAGRRSYNDLWESLTFMQMAERVFQNTKINKTSSSTDSNFYFVDYSFSIQGKLSDKDEIQLNTIYAKNELSFDNNVVTSTFSDDLITENEGYSLLWQRKYSANFSQNTRLNLSNYILDYSFSRNESQDASLNEKDIKQNYINDIGAQTFGELKLGKRSSLQFGYEYSKTNIRFALESRNPNISIILDEEKNELDSHSIFSQYELKGSDNLLVQLGIRGNSYSVSDKLFVEPRIYFQIPVLSNVHINTSFSLRSQAITQIQESVISSLSLENQLWQITDNDLDVLNTRQVSIGATYKTNDWFIELDSYMKRTNNITSLATGLLAPGTQALDAGLSSIEGVELFVKKKFKDYATWASYSYTQQKNKFEEINNNQFFTSNLNIDHTFKWLHFYKFKNFQFSLSWLWHTGKTTTDSHSVSLIANGGEARNLNEQNLPIYHKLDVSGLYNFKFSKKLKCQLGVSVLNAYNRKSIINREFRPAPGISKDFFTLDFEALGITPNVSMRFFW